MILNYTLTKKQLLNFHKKHILNTLQFKEFSHKVKIFYILMLVMIWCAVEYDMKFKIFVGFIFVGIFLYVFKKKIYLYCFQFKMTKLYCNYKKKYLFDPIILSINSDGVILNTSMNDELIKWKGIRDFNIIDNNILIRTFTKDNIFIPYVCIKQNELKILQDLFKKYNKMEPQYNYPKDMQFI